MSVPVRRRRQAQDELLAYVDRIADDSPDAAIRFIEAFERLCANLSRHPEMAPTHQSDEPALRELQLRRVPVPEFTDYLVFYAFDGDSVDVLHVLHARLDLERRLYRR